MVPIHRNKVVNSGRARFPKGQDLEWLEVRAVGSDHLWGINRPRDDPTNFVESAAASSVVLSSKSSTSISHTAGDCSYSEEIGKLTKLPGLRKDESSGVRFEV